MEEIPRERGCEGTKKSPLSALLFKEEQNKKYQSHTITVHIAGHLCCVMFLHASENIRTSTLFSSQMRKNLQ